MCKPSDKDTSSAQPWNACLLRRPSMPAIKAQIRKYAKIHSYISNIYVLFTFPKEKTVKVKGNNKM